MRILIAPNAFKHSVDAATAARAIERGLRKGNPACNTVLCPVGDGGDGTGQLLTDACEGVLTEHEVHDPLGRKIMASYGWLPGNTAVIEMAAASGIRLLQQGERDPVNASSFGTGELMRHALDRGAEKIWLCVGGSATIDGGSGILQALGIRFIGGDQRVIEQLPARMNEIREIDISDLHPRVQETEILILCDVSNPLLGNAGAVKVFGAQKGVLEKQVDELETRLDVLRRAILHTSGIDIGAMKYGGAAGGVTAGLCGTLGAKAVNGIEFFLNTVSFNRKLEGCSLVITGEGSIDEQTLDGKAPFGVAMRAKKKNIPVIALTGRRNDLSESLLEVFHNIVPVNEEGMGLEEALRSAEKNLERVAAELLASL